tara:strand:- start:14 stop:694 length:681 start_codon:yes stop_codon:yes gene_type:complete
MASTRLTNSIKEALVNQLLDHAFAHKSQEQHTAECDLAQQVYDHIMDTRKLRDGHLVEMTLRSLVAQLPTGWGSQEDYFYVEFGGQTTRLDKYDGIAPTYGQSCSLRGIKAVLGRNKVKWSWPPRWGGHGTVATYDAHHKFTLRSEQLKGAREDLEAEILTAGASARATMDSVSTVQKLIVLWPEVEAFACQFLSAEKAAAVLLPVVQREKLNDVLGLPPHARAVA